MIPELSDRIQELRIRPARDACREIAKLLLRLRKESLPGDPSHEAQLFLVIVDFDGEVCNGGIAQYFTNPAGKNHQKVIEGLTHFGLTQQCDILERWLQLLPPNVDPADRNRVGAWIFADDGKRLAQSERLDAEYYRSRDQFYEGMVQGALGL